MDNSTPQAVEIEKAILGAIIVEPESFLLVANILNSDCFYDHKNKLVYLALEQMHTRSENIDILSLSLELDRLGKLEEVGGNGFLIGLTKDIASANHIEFHAKIVREKYILRQLITLSNDVQTDIYQKEDIDDIFTKISSKIDELQSSVSSSQLMQTSVLKKALEEVEADCIRTKSGIVSGIPTGLLMLDRATGGWKSNNYIILAARPSVGKTSLALHFAKQAALAGFWVNFYGLEMSSPDLMRIMLSGESAVSRTKLRDGKLEDSDWAKINAGVRQLERLPIIWSDYADVTVQYIRDMTRKNKKEGKCDLVIVDYLQLITPTDKRVNREQQVSEISRTFKKITLSGVPVIAVAQLNREADTGKPLLSHLRESGSLEQDADIVVFPWRDDNNYKITIGKNRRGITGTFDIAVNDELTWFGDIGAAPFIKDLYNDDEKD